MRKIRRFLAIGSIIIGGTAVAIPDEVVSKFCIALATSMNAASLYILKEEHEEIEGLQ